MEKAFLVDVFANELTKAFRSDAEFEVEAGGHQSFDLMLASMDSSSKPVELHQIMWLNSVHERMPQRSLVWTPPQPGRYQA